MAEYQMRITVRVLVVLLTAALLGLTQPLSCPAAHEYINISDPFIKKVPIAIPMFKVMSGKPEEAQIAAKASELMTDTLEFTGYFKMIAPAAFLEAPHKTGIVASALNFRNWTVVGAELLVTGGILASDGIIEMECRLFDTFKQRLLVGKRYKGRETDLRRMVRRFCSEVVYSLTGNKGIFDSKIAFVSNGSGNKEIYVCDFDGYHPERVTHANTIALSPAWSSDGNWLAYTSYEKGKPDLYIKHMKEKRGTVVAFKGSNITPAWFPGKFSLAACLSYTGDQEIYLLTGTGKIIKRLTDSWGIDVSPSFSPDGKQMAFVSKRSGTPQIHIQDLETGQSRRLTYHGRYNTSPSWSPAGDKIAYVGFVDGQINIYVIRTDGTGLLQFTANAGDNESPTWSPDGSLVAFSSTREGPARIYVMTAFGTDQRRLFALKGEQTNPKWSPGNVNY